MWQACVICLGYSSYAKKEELPGSISHRGIATVRVVDQLHILYLYIVGLKLFR